MLTNKNKVMSKTRKIYFLRLIFRIAVFIATVVLYISDETAFDIVTEWEFFDNLSPVHILWVIWIADMVLQLIPVKAHISIGSQKVFKFRFRPAEDGVDYKRLKKYINNATVSAYKVMLIWVVLTVVISILHICGITDTGMLVLLATFFYVCDLICVLIWCPFRLIMGNRCCTTCRIFNWDHLMMFLPIVALNSFFSWSLVILSVVIWLIWELCVLWHPERFWEVSNKELRCLECTDKLCTQYCRKLSKNKF